MLLGVDAGGTHTRAVVWRGGGVAGRGASSGANPHRVGLAAAAAALGDAIAGAARSAGCTFVDAACVGLAGVSHGGASGAVAAAFERAGVRVGGLRLVADVDLVYAAGFGAGAPRGVALVAGTGSVAVAMDAAGRRVMVGGAGPWIGDEGSAHAIGATALRVAAETPDSVLAHAVITVLRTLPAGLTLAEAAAGARARAFEPAPLAVAASRAAAAGDADALRILRDAGHALARLAVGASSAAGLGSGFVVRTHGGVVAEVACVREVLGECLAAAGGVLGPPVVDALDGALFLAAARAVPPQG